MWKSELTRDGKGIFGEGKVNQTQASAKLALTILPTRDVPNIRVSDPNIRVGDPKIRVSVPNIRVTDPNIRVSVDEKF